MTQPRSVSLVGSALFMTYTVFLLGVSIYARRSSITPIVLDAPDVLVGEDTPVSVRVVALHAVTGARVRGVSLRFVRELAGSDGPGELAATTGLDGAATVTFPELNVAPGGTSSTGGMGSRVAVLLAQPSLHVLAGPWPARVGEPKRAWTDIIELHSRTRILLVDLDAALDRRGLGRPAPGWPPSPPPSLSDRVLEESRSRSQTLYVATLLPTLEQRCKAWIAFSGLPDGALGALAAGQKKESEIAALADRLRELQVEINLVIAGPGVDSLYSRCFPGTALMAYER